MRLAGLEWKKLMRTPVVWIAAAALAALNVFLFVTMDNIYFAPASADGIAHIQQEKEQGAYFKGAVTEDWISRYRAEVEAIRENPDNQLKGRDREEKMQQLLAQGYDRDYIEENLQLEFLKPEVLQSEEYERYESVEWAGLFYEQAAKCGAQYAAYYGGTIQRQKGSGSYCFGEGKIQKAGGGIYGLL